MSHIKKAILVALSCIALSACGMLSGMFNINMETWVGHNWHEFDRAEHMSCHPAQPGKVECVGLTLYVSTKGAITGWDWHPGINL